MSPNLQTIARIANDVVEGRITSLDGTRSPLGRRIRAHWRRDDFDMACNWVLLPQDWTCPGCARTKLDVTRLGRDGRILAKVVDHHDHMVSAAYDLFSRSFKGDKRSAVYNAAVDEMWEIGNHLRAFDNVLVCEDCNNADANAAKQIGAPPSFSFSSQHIRQFIKPVAHQRHEIDAAKLDTLWREINPVHAQRASLMTLLVDGFLRDDRRFGNDVLSVYNARAWYAEPAEQPNQRKSDPPPYWRESDDGEWKSREIEIALCRALNVPSDAALAQWRTVSHPPAKAPSPHAIAKAFAQTRWRGTAIPADWHCPICGRAKELTCFLDPGGTARFEVANYWRPRVKGPPIPACLHCVETADAARQELVVRAGLTWFEAGDAISTEKLREMIIPQNHGPHTIRADIAKQLIDAAIAAGPRP